EGECFEKTLRLPRALRFAFGIERAGAVLERKDQVRQSGGLPRAMMSRIFEGKLQMLASGAISPCGGVLQERDVPADLFLEQIEKRGISASITRWNEPGKKEPHSCGLCGKGERKYEKRRITPLQTCGAQFRPIRSNRYPTASSCSAQESGCSR